MGNSNPSTSHPATERRVIARLDAHEHAFIRRLDGDNPHSELKEQSCGILDLSQNGIRLFTRQSCVVGEEVEITIERAGFGRAHTMLGVVRWLSPSREVRGYFLGLEFLDARDLSSWKRTFH